MGRQELMEPKRPEHTKNSSYGYDKIELVKITVIQLDDMFFSVFIPICLFIFIKK